MAGFVDNSDEDEVVATINIVPFVDIVLVLLIIFLLTANIIAKGAIPVDLPNAAVANEIVDPTANVVITAAGDLFVDGQPATRESMGADIGARFKQTPKLRVVIAADKAVRYELVVQVIDTLKQVGVGAFALNIEKSKP